MIIEPLVLAHVWVPGAAAPGSGDGGQGRGRSPSQEGHPLPRLRPTRGTAVPGAGAAGMGAGIGTRARRGDLPARPPSLPRIPAGGPGMLLAAPPGSCQQNGSAFARCLKKPLQSRSQPR